MMPLGLLVWPLVALLGAVGLHAVAPRHSSGQYLLPVVRTVAVITVATLFVTAIWSH
ncbi:hypothetical protein ACFYOF_06385 [Streptomyces sp. NPDC007148]|uniref:hypothetical protein n=1 Tax=unclassified Streptomyces TaxID=2593676 RepID=UPI0036C47A7E